MDAGDPPRRRGGVEPAVRRGLGLLVVQPLLVKAPLLLGLLQADPRATWSGLADASRRSLVGTPSIDPNIAYTSHALGSLAARLAWSGRSLWWNAYEGVGAPLAGEMQSAALFPPTWLLILPQGQLIEHLIFQVIAGCATFLLLRRLGAGPLGAWLGGTAFAFNGAYAWLANAVVNPICFLPVMILGIEWLRAADRPAIRRGGPLVAVGLAASLYAGFPEVAYLDGLLVAAWTMLRALESAAARRQAIGFLGRVALFGLAGCLLAAPVLVAFADYLPVAELGMHDGTAGVAAMSGRYAGMMLVPYFMGLIYAGGMGFWGPVGGYAGVALVTLAAAGCFARRDRPLRLLLAGCAIVIWAAMFGVPPFAALVGIVPGVAYTAFSRYADASVFMALAVLAGLAIDDLASGRLPIVVVRRAALGVFIVAIALVGAAFATGVRPEKIASLAPTIAQIAMLTAFGAAICWRRLSPQRRWPAVALTGAAEIVLLFAIPIAGYPYRSRLELGGVDFLQRHLGLQRFVSLGAIGTPGTISANYGSYFGIAQLNHNDLPAPRDWANYTRQHLDPHADPIIFNPADPALFLARLPAYAAVGVRYVVAPGAQPLPGLRQVFANGTTHIYVLPDVRPYAAAPGCAMRARSRTEFDAVCARPSRLERLELFMPGWTATVGGRPAPVTRSGEIFQAIPLPAGASRVRFAFAPPYLAVAYALAVGGLVLLGLGLIRGAPLPRERSPIRGYDLDHA